MRALTVCQPYPYLMFLPREDPRWKGVENRTWRTTYRGPLLIHAGLSKRYIHAVGRGYSKSGNISDLFPQDEEYGIPLEKLTLGAIIGQVDLVDCLSLKRGPHRQFNDPTALRRYSWLFGHRHVEGPVCWILANPRKFVEPIPFRGAQGLFNVPESTLEGARFA